MSQAERLVNIYRQTYSQQREIILDTLRQYPGYPAAYETSIKQLLIVLSGLTAAGVMRKDALFAVDGSHSYGVATENSDCDGVVFLYDANKNIQETEVRIDEELRKRRVESNIRVLSYSWKPEGEKFARAEKVGIMSAQLLSGLYILGSYDELPIVHILENHTDILSYIQQILEERFRHPYLENDIAKYKQRVEGPIAPGGLRK